MLIYNNSKGIFVFFVTKMLLFNMVEDLKNDANKERMKLKTIKN